MRGKGGEGDQDAYDRIVGGMLEYIRQYGKEQADSAVDEFNRGFGNSSRPNFNLNSFKKALSKQRIDEESLRILKKRSKSYINSALGGMENPSKSLKRKTIGDIEKIVGLVSKEYMDSFNDRAAERIIGEADTVSFEDADLEEIPKKYVELLKGRGKRGEPVRMVRLSGNRLKDLSFLDEFEFHHVDIDDVSKGLDVTQPTFFRVASDNRGAIRSLKTHAYDNDNEEFDDEVEQCFDHIDSVIANSGMMLGDISPTSGFEEDVVDDIMTHPSCRKTYRMLSPTTERMLGWIEAGTADGEKIAAAKARLGCGDLDRVHAIAEKTKSGAIKTIEESLMEKCKVKTKEGKTILL